MCGIAGMLRFGGSPDPAVLAAMSSALAHRGPDSAGQAVYGPVGLAARRLAIIDLEGGDQPITTADGRITVVQNGEIYNYVELREELQRRGHRFSTRSDTEVLAHLYEEEGTAFLGRLRGMYAIALWDRAVDQLLLARDPFGIKPLYYRLTADGVSFASELTALTRDPSFPTELDGDALEALLTFNSIPAPLSIYQAARKLPAGHLMRCRRGDVAIECHARPAPALASEVAKEPLESLAETAQERLRDSVRAHLVADVPVGILLSGGVDSSMLTALAATESTERVSTFSIGFEESSFNELPLARQVAERYGTDHHELVLRPDAAELLSKIAAAFDEPFADSSAIPTYLVSQLASDHVKVVLSGEGGDELFGGYETYVADVLAQWVGPAARALRPLVERLPTGSGRVPLDYKAKRFVRAAHLPPLERHHGWKEIFSTDARADLLRTQARPAFDPVALYRERFGQTQGSELLARLQDVDIGIYLTDDLLVKTDRMSMAHSLEARVPFLDHVVAELALALPTHAKVRGTAKKRVLRRAARSLLPTSVTTAGKRGFSIPAADWLRGPLGEFARDVLAPDRVRREGYFEPNRVTALLDAHVRGREDLSRQLWCLMSFSLWHDTAPRPSTATAGVGA